MAESASTFRLFITSFTDFLTVAVHTILYERAIYPQTSFLSARKYNLPVRQSRHPKVCEWINDAVAAVEAELFKGTVERVAVMIYDKAPSPSERYVFDVSRFPTVPPSEIDTHLEGADESGEKYQVLPIVDMEEQFRATLSKLAGSSAMLKPLPEACTFTVAIELKKSGAAPVAHPQPWMPAQTKRQRSNDKAQTVVTEPVRSVDAGEMVFDTWIEQVRGSTDKG